MIKNCLRTESNDPSSLFKLKKVALHSCLTITDIISRTTLVENAFSVDDKWYSLSRPCMSLVLEPCDNEAAGDFDYDYDICTTATPEDCEDPLVKAFCTSTCNRCGELHFIY